MPARLVALLPPLALVALVGCPEERPDAVRPPPRPPQAMLSAGAQNQPDVLTLARPTGPEWFGIYLGGRKAGWTKVQLATELRDGRNVLVGRSEMLMRVNVGGKTVERSQTEERVYEARPGGRLLSFRAVFGGDGGDRTVTGTCNTRERCTATIESPGGAHEERTLDGVTETADLADGVRLAAARRTTVRGRQIEFMKLRVRDQQDAFVRRERVAGAGVQEEVSVVEEIEIGDRMPVVYQVADDGRVVEIRYGDAIVSRPETEDRARTLDTVDLFALGRVALPRALPRTVPAAITYRIEGLPPAFDAASPRQKVARDGKAALLTVTARIPAAADPAKDTPLAKAKDGARPDDLAATAEVDSDAPTIQRLARETAGSAPGAYAAAKLLATKVYGTLEKAYGASHDRASDVLVAGKGDCTEHAVLMVALARALGIPARQVYGLVYARYSDGQDALYWHAWAQVRSAAEWIDVDPIFDQPVADATHVALGTGTQVDVVGLLGSLKVTGVEVKEGK
ncbi:transglutaminase-like domain-containing protein [Anaeromyxobacter oryzae]|uniref:Transglutaminase n=1 Tax=Anaeromyxobacter oryzae TaxID=2918170 RepID=A0ABM7WWQ6_9BACT|nr:transglutaminase-like domain-containing protein [Anaeromyxobacter oryzae]BDG03931.1 transglutaminase [Anaeromyxobacter oryzae]